MNEKRFCLRVLVILSFLFWSLWGLCLWALGVYITSDLRGILLTPTEGTDGMWWVIGVCGPVGCFYTVKFWDKYWG